jgi:hypothetical protein
VKEELPFPATREAKVEICFLTCSLWQLGQVTSSAALALRTSSSKGSPQSAHMNSKIGMVHSWNDCHCDKEIFLTKVFGCTRVSKVTPFSQVGFIFPPY